MIAAWMLSAVLVGVLVTAGAMAADRVLVSLRRQTRAVWLAAMGITIAWPAIAYTRSWLAEGSSARAPLSGSVQQLTAIVIRASERSLHMRADVLLLAGWSLLSAILLARMFFTVRALRARGRSWRAQHVDGVLIRLSRDVGPAVVGLDPMEVVLPEWALDLEPPLRAMVLAHEEEHRRARDPHLLMISAALIVLVPWNPALWIQARRLRLAIELDCDARVLRSHPQPERYGLLLLAIAQRRSAGMSLLAPALSERTSNLERRINAMNSPLKNESRVRLAVLGGIAVALVVVACAIDAPVAPTAAPRARATEELGHIMAEPEGRRERGDSTRGFAVTAELPTGKDEFLVWTRDSAGKPVTAKVRYNPGGSEREREQRIREERASEGRHAEGTYRAEPTGPIVERGKVEQKYKKTEGIGLASPTPPPGGELREKVAAPAQVRNDGPYYEFQVEKVAAWIQGTGAPTYPPELKLAGVEGEVLVSFTVDQLGRVDSGSLRVLKSTNETFLKAVSTKLADMRFTPALVGGRAVAQRVQQSFQFSVK